MPPKYQIYRRVSLFPTSGHILIACVDCSDDSLAALTQRLEGKAKRMRQMLGVVRAENVPLDWVPSDLATHLRGIAKLLARARNGLVRGLQREAGRIDAELARAEAEGEDWAIAWRKRAPSFERIWRDVEQRVADFLKQAAALRSWLPLNERLASLAALGAKVSGTDPALARTVRRW